MKWENDDMAGDGGGAVADLVDEYDVTLWKIDRGKMFHDGR